MARIIVIDDDELIGELVVSALTAAGHIVGLVRNGALGLETIRAKRPDLVILDRALPGMAGIEVLRRIRQDPALYLMPVVMLTGHRREQDLDSAYGTGATDYVTKPFEPADLVTRVEHALEVGKLHRITR